MKFKILFVILLIFPVFIFAQTENQIASWLYGLPIKKDSKDLKKLLVQNINFVQRQPGSANSKHSDLTYSGKILDPKLPNAELLDSARIELLFGKLNAVDNYSGDIKILIFQYYTNDTTFIDKLYDSANSDLREGSKIQGPTGFRTLNNESVGRGTKFIYKNSHRKISKIEIFKVKHSNGTRSFQVLYVGSTK